MRGTEGLPQGLVDPITYEPFADPVIAADGHTYERSSILDWLRRCREQGLAPTSPLTRQPIGDELRDNLVVRQLLQELSQSVEACAEAADARAAGAWRDASFRSVRSGDAFDVPGAVLLRVSRAMEGLDEEEASRLWDDALGTKASLAALTPIFEAIDPIRDLLTSLDSQTPQIVVMGNENSGKSTLLERIAMMPLFPTDKRICTRMVIKICLRRGEPQPPLLEVREVATNEVVRSQPMAMDAAAACIEEWMREEVQRENGGAVSGVCRSRMLVVHVQSSSAPNLDLVDLPGLVEAQVHGEPDDMREQTRQLVEDYLDRCTQHSLFLVTMPANSGPNLSIAMDIVQRRNLQRFTIGVLTKADLVLYRDAEDDDDEDAESRAEELRSKLDQRSSDVVPLHPHGYVAAMNKKTRQRYRCRHEELVDQAVREIRWFQAKGFGADPRVSVRALVTLLMLMYHEFVADTWLPGAVTAIEAEIARLNERDAELGLPRAHDVACIDPAALSAAAQTKYRQLVWAATLAALCARLHAEALNGGQLFETATTTQPIWQLATWLQEQSDRRVAELERAVTRCIALGGQHVCALLAADDSNFKFGRFQRVIGRIGAHLERLLEEWRGEVQAALAEVIRGHHRVECGAHITLTHSLDAAAPDATVSCQVDYSKLNAAVCQAVMEGVCRCLLSLRWDDAVPDAGDPEIWLESCAEERTRLLQRLDDAMAALQRLRELAQEVEVTRRRTNLECLRVAAAMGDMRQASASAQWLVERLRQLSSLDACESLGEGGAVEIVHVALEQAGAAGDSGAEAAAALLQLVRCLANYGGDYSQERKITANLERLRELGTVPQICQTLSHGTAAVVAAAMDCLACLHADRRLAKAMRDRGAIDLAIQAMGRHHDSPEVAESGCRLLSVMSRAAANSAKLHETSVSEAVVRALDRHVAAASVAEWACRAIVELCETNNRNVARFQAVNAREVLARATEQHADGGDALVWAQRATDCL